MSGRNMPQGSGPSQGAGESGATQQVPRIGGSGRPAAVKDAGRGIRPGIPRGRFWHGAACALVGGALWGVSGACSQFLFTHYHIAPTFLTCARMLGAGVLFLVLLLVLKRPVLAAMFRDRRTVGRLVVFGIGGLFLCQITYVVVVSYTNAGTATVLQSTCTVFVMLFACLFARKLPHAAEVAGLVLAAAATWLVATQGDPSALVLPVLGLVWGLANSLSCTFYIMYPKRLFTQWGSLPVTGIGMLIGGVAALAVWLVDGLLAGGGALGGALGGTAAAVAGTGGTAAAVAGTGGTAAAVAGTGGTATALPAALVPVMDLTGWLVLAAVAVVGTFASFALYLHGVSVVGSVTGSLLGAVEPVSATLCSALWLGTVFTGADWAGLVLMVGMIFLVSFGGAPKQAASAPVPSDQESPRSA